MLRSVDEILRTDHHNMPANLGGGVRGMAGARAGLSRYMDEEVLDRYNAPIFDRLATCFFVGHLCNWPISSFFL